MVPGEAGGPTGVIQHVHSGQKRRFEGLASLWEAMRRMVQSQLPGLKD